MINLRWVIKYGLLILISFIGGRLDAQNPQKIINKEYQAVLPELMFKDSALISQIDSLVLRNELCSSNRESYIYSMNIVKNDIEINLMPNSILGITCNLGFFLIRNSLFVVCGDIDPLFCVINKEDQFIYTKRLINMKGKLLDYDSLQSEEFSTWYLTFHDQQLQLIDILCYE